MIIPDEKRFTEWWKQIQPAIFAAGSRYLGSADAVKDLAQDVAISAFLQFKIFRDVRHFEAWCVTRAYWLALDRLKIKRRRELISDEIDDTKGTVATQEQAAELAQIFEIVSRFPKHQQLALLRTFEGYSTSEIARELGVSVATVRSLRRHARYRLVQELMV